MAARWLIPWLLYCETVGPVADADHPSCHLASAGRCPLQCTEKVALLPW